MGICQRQGSISRDFSCQQSTLRSTKNSFVLLHLQLSIAVGNMDRAKKRSENYSHERLLSLQTKRRRRRRRWPGWVTMDPNDSDCGRAREKLAIINKFVENFKLDRGSDFQQVCVKTRTLTIGNGENLGLGKLGRGGLCESPSSAAQSLGKSFVFLSKCKTGGHGR